GHREGARAVGELRHLVVADLVAIEAGRLLAGRGRGRVPDRGDGERERGAGRAGEQRTTGEFGHRHPPDLEKPTCAIRSSALAADASAVRPRAKWDRGPTPNERAATRRPLVDLEVAGLTASAASSPARSRSRFPAWRYSRPPGTDNDTPPSACARPPACRAACAGWSARDPESCRPTAAIRDCARRSPDGWSRRRCTSAWRCRRR